MLESLPALAVPGPHPSDEGGGSVRHAKDAPSDGPTFDALVRRASGHGPELPDDEASDELAAQPLAGLAAWLPPPKVAAEAAQQGPDRLAEVPTVPPADVAAAASAIEVAVTSGATNPADAPPADDTAVDAQVTPEATPVQPAAAEGDPPASRPGAPAPVEVPRPTAAGGTIATDGPPGLERAAERIAELDTPAEAPPAHGARARFELDPSTQPPMAAQAESVTPPQAVPVTAGSDGERAPTADGEQPAMPPTVVVDVTAAAAGGEVASAEAASPEVDSVKLIARLAETVQSALTRGPREIRISLRPPELGHLDLRVVESGDGLRVAIEASTRDARDLLQRELPVLRTALEARDLRVHRLDVQLADRGASGMLADGGPADRRDQPGGGPGRGQERAAEPGPGLDSAGDTRTDRSARVAEASLTAAPGRIDLRV